MEMSCNYKCYIDLFITVHLVGFYHEVNFNCGFYVFRLKAQSELKWDWIEYRIGLNAAVLLESF